MVTQTALENSQRIRPGLHQTLARYFTAGIIAGLVLFLLEAVDQSIVLTPFFHSFAERLSYLSLLSLTIVGFAVISLLVGVAALGLGSVMNLVTGGVNGHNASEAPPRLRRALIFFSVLIIYSILLALIFKNPFHNDLVRAIAFYGSYAEAVGRVVLKHSFALLALAIFVILLMARLLYSLLSEFFSQPIRILLLLGLLGAIIFSYWWDSRLYFGLYERTVRRLSFSFDLVACLIFGLALEKILSQRETISQVALRLKGGLFICGIAAIIVAGVGISRFDSHEGLRALFMHRSVIARRYVNLIRWLADRDGDGFSSILGGGDCDDRNPAVNPTAREIPGNGVDENCLGGDLAEGVLSDQAQTDREKEKAVLNVAPETEGGNIVLITIDALRADHLGCYGYARNTSPHIDRFASQSTLFLNAYSQATSTGHSFASLVKSSYGEAVFDERRQTLIEILSSQGYETAFFQAKDIAQQLILQLAYRSLPRKGVKTEIHPTAPMQWTARDLTHQAVDYLKDVTRADRRFVWIHYLDPHRPYVAHPGFDFGKSEVDLYDGEIAYLDGELQQLFVLLESPEIADKTLVILTADHGESFLEHGQLGHSSMSYQDVIRVPLIVRHPRKGPERVQTPVGLIDVAPTILRFAGIEVPTWHEGNDLFSSSARARRPIFTESQRTAPGPIFFNYAVIDGDWKLIYDFVPNTFELYSLKEDPRERRNLVEINREKAAELRRVLTRWIDMQSTQPIRSGIWSIREVLR